MRVGQVLANEIKVKSGTQITTLSVESIQIIYTDKPYSVVVANTIKAFG
ncbi:MAG: hypothetical protein R2879_07700 [Saprospiraceae bacterium]